MYVIKFVDDIKVNPKDVQSYTNSQRKDNQGSPPLKRRNGSGFAESERKCLVTTGCQQSFRSGDNRLSLDKNVC